MDLEELRSGAKLMRDLLGSNYSRYLDLLQCTELAEKVMEIDNPKQKHIALSRLIEQIANDLPGAILEQRDLMLSNHTLRVSDLCSDILPLAMFGGTQFSHCVNLLSGYRKEVEQWECDDAATIAMRKERLIELEGCFGYEPFEPFDANDPLGGNDHFYYRGGAYREYDEHKNSYYFRLGRMIQTHDAVGGDLELTMQKVCLYVALINERNFVEEELSLLGIDISGNNKQMQWSDISELREAANGYLSLLRVGGFGNNQDTAATVCRLHDAIANVKVNEIGNVLARFNVYQHTIVFEVECIISIVEQLIGEIGMKMPTVKPFDPGVTEVFKFCKGLLSVMTIELTKLRNRYATDPTEGDEDAGERLMSYLNGDYGDMEFWVFYNDFLIDDLRRIPSDEYTQALCRRLNYLISICTDNEIKDMMIDWVDGIQHEIDTPEPPGNEQAAEATDTPDVAQFTPTIAFEMSALYSFLVGEGVIDEGMINDPQFENCINLADIKPLWETTPSKNTLKLALSVLKEYYQDNIQKRKRINPSWYLHCCESVDMSAQDMSKMNIKQLKRDNFCREMKKSISLP